MVGPFPNNWKNSIQLSPINNSSRENKENQYCDRGLDTCS